MAQLVEVTDSAVLGGVVEVVSSIPGVGHKFFLAFSGIVDLIYSLSLAFSGIVDLIYPLSLSLSLSLYIYIYIYISEKS